MEPQGGNLATMRRGLRKTIRKAPDEPVVIYAGRQPKRPHYLAKLMERHEKDRSDLIEDLGIDKSTLSRWLDPDRPSTPSEKWAKKLGRYFASGPEDEDFVDIFTNPSAHRFQKITKGRSEEEIDRMLATLEAAFPAKRA